MWIKAEIIEGHAYLLGEDGCIWRISFMGWDAGPIMEKVERLNRDQFKALAGPSLLRFHHR